MTNRYRGAQRRSATLFAGLVAMLACAALLFSGAAVAEPVWDIEAYDDCTQALDDGIDNTINWINTANEYCCKHSGGVWNDDQKQCAAPPAEGQGAGQQLPQPPRGELPTVAVAPPGIGTPPTRPMPVFAPEVPVQPPIG
ncbi:hypothetical protein [Mycobacterium sp. IDR2000157661]|uniref:hypothetical protein n=1 Tax=Mycobacterium sp. IDR2000157661 TaxID=2867005 RepID=UPI001EEE0571|nr:hypothetical protein [Mycobacterium sp. IDR2000157661]ULE34903.1 hypothetical protein K3G64_10160 [Mycobacterium sp. IDR2000157661]